MAKIGKLSNLFIEVDRTGKFDQQARPITSIG